jgi:diaminobutyrate-2-oxoglutarate transaminase
MRRIAEGPASGTGERAYLKQLAARRLNQHSSNELPIGHTNHMDIFAELESNVRNYSRSFPVVFKSACGAQLTDETGRNYIDFLSGAGALNYGHNNPHLKSALLEYLSGDGVTQSLDMATTAKREFIAAFERLILKPRALSYRLQFTGPTGAHAVEAALALARKVTGRSGLIAFTNAFHGMTQGALAVTANRRYRMGRAQIGNVTFLPYEGFANGFGAIDYVETCLSNPGSGIDPPAAFIVETVQGEGGVNVASAAWLQQLAALARREESLLIVDEVQVGCGRTGPFFSFERAGIKPDLVCLSKSLSGYGLPMALTLIRPELDAWSPGEHSGTFRGNNLAFVTARTALDRYWHHDTLAKDVSRKGQIVGKRLQAIAAGANRRSRNAPPLRVRGCGLIQGIDCGDAQVASAFSRKAFECGLIVETCGNHDQVVKLLPPLTIADAELEAGLDLLEEAISAPLA